MYIIISLMYIFPFYKYKISTTKQGLHMIWCLAESLSQWVKKCWALKSLLRVILKGKNVHDFFFFFFLKIVVAVCPKLLSCGGPNLNAWNSAAAASSEHMPRLIRFIRGSRCFGVSVTVDYPWSQCSGVYYDNSVGG